MIRAILELLRAIPWLGFLFAKSRVDELEQENEELKGLLARKEVEGEVAELDGDTAADRLRKWQR